MSKNINNYNSYEEAFEAYLMECADKSVNPSEEGFREWSFAKPDSEKTYRPFTLEEAKSMVGRVLFESVDGKTRALITVVAENGDHVLLNGISAENFVKNYYFANTKVPAGVEEK